ncbi:MAG TPA: hypothetical protein VHW44_31555 [Pseudonocardiaceae bacterium]|jgi:Mce-associated membrane protein|nr:hypothetical protein [Pseudonocardiaceae bacterium]
MTTPQPPQQPSSQPRRRAPIPVTPPRRPRVAGLRKPTRADEQSPATDEQADDHDTQIIPVVPAEETFGGTLTDNPPATEPDAPDAPETTEAAAESPRPSPTRRRKPRPAPEPEPESAEADTPEPQSAERESAADASWSAFQSTSDDLGTVESPRRSRLLVPMILGAVAVLLGAFAIVAFVEWHSLRYGTAVRNTALTDNAGTSEVTGEVTSAVNTMFSYNYTNLSKTQSAVQSLLTGDAVCQYNLIFKDVQSQAPSQKLVLSTTVVSSGVEMLDGDDARVLLVVDQHDTRATTNQVSDSTAAFAVNATRVSGKWKISAINTFNGQQTQGCAK